MTITAGAPTSWIRSASSRLHQVRGDDGREREQPIDERLDGIVLEQLRAGARDHDRIDHERNAVHAQEIGDGVDQLPREEHARLCGIDSDVGEHGLELRLDELRRQLLHGGHAERVLCGQRNDRARPEAAGGSKRLQVGLDPGSASRVGAGDRETSRNGQSTPFAGMTRIWFRGCVLSLGDEAPR